MIQWRQHGPTLLKRAQAIKAHGIQPLENVAIFPVLRGATVFLDKPLYLLESGDNPLLPGRTSAFLLWLAMTFRSRSRFASKFLFRFTATFLSRFAETFLLRFAATLRCARNSCFL